MTLEESRMLKFWDKKPTSYSIPAHYYENHDWYKTAFSLRDSFIQQGYLTVSDCYQNIGLRTVPELKAILADRELKISGRKAELIQRIEDNFDQFEIEDMFSIGVYQLTEMGTEVIQQFSIYDENTYNFPYLRLREAKDLYPDATNEEIYESLLIQDLRKQLADNDYESLSITSVHISELLCKHSKYKEAMKILSIAFHELYHGEKQEINGDLGFRIHVQGIIYKLNLIIAALQLSVDSLKQEYFSFVLPLLSNKAFESTLDVEFSVLKKLLTGEINPQSLSFYSIWGIREKPEYDFIGTPPQDDSINAPSKWFIIFFIIVTTIVAIMMIAGLISHL